MFNVKEIDAATLSTMMAEQDIALIDVRSPAEFAQGIIPGAVNIPLHLVPMQLEQFKQDKPVVIYCRSGARSAQACAFLGAQGIDGTLNLRGGIIAWAQGGLAVA